MNVKSIREDGKDDMSTPEDKLAHLERKVAALELQQMYDERKAEENVPAMLGFHLREINENMTTMLNVIGSQVENEKKVQDDIRLLKEGVSSIDGKLEQVLQLLRNQSSGHQ
jgi:hypothetical protein